MFRQTTRDCLEIFKPRYSRSRGLRDMEFLGIYPRLRILMRTKSPLYLWFFGMTTEMLLK